VLDRLPRPRRLRRIRPTREGTIFFVTGLAVAGAALNTGNNLLYLIFALMLGLVALSGVLSEVAVQRLKVERRIHGRVFAGRPARGTWTVRNPRRRLPTLAVRISELPAREALLQDSVEPSLPYVAAGATAVRPGTWWFSRRGVHRLRGVRVSTTWPFGILRKWYDLEAPLDVLVLPTPGTVAAPADAARLGADESSRVSLTRGGGDFLGLREHRSGEGLRDIHWRSTARLRRRVVAERAMDSEPVAVVKVERPTGPLAERSDTLERSLGVAVATVIDAEQRSADLRVEFWDAPPRQVRSLSERDGVLKQLALLRLEDR
jgi:uncharacterized protein (DUF58 family)